MTISEWIDQREMTGFPTFSYNEISEAFPALSSQAVSNELYRLGRRKRIMTVHKGFYIAVSMQYRINGIVPSFNYIDQLMSHLKRPYYVSLLSAGVLNGAAHQRPQRLSVTTVLPRISISKNSNNQLYWNYRREIPTSMLCQTNSDTGILLFSNPELTSIDLVQYSHLIGGLSAAATVIAELVEKTNFLNYSDELIHITTLPTLQRLGFMLDVILDDRKTADEINEILMLNVKNLKFRPLSTDCSQDIGERDSKWKIIINQKIEPDEL